ncbi:MAG: glycosyltransferase family 2 protein [Myxococcota bacterium]
MLLSALAGSTAAAVTLPGTLELAFLTAGSLRPPRPKPSTRRPIGRLAVVIPAHDEEAGIAACVASLKACAPPPGGVRLLVVADNCTDATAARAREAGADVIERHEDDKRGKGYALELACAHVLEDPSVEVVLVVDADTRVRPNFLVAMHEAFALGADAAQARYVVSNPDVDRWRNVAFMAINVARPMGRERWGLSVGILGNGFGLHRRVLEALPYMARSLVEDLEYHLMLVRAGFTVRFVEETAVAADLPTTKAAEKTQRARWEGGRLQVMRTVAPALARELVRRRDPRLLEPLGELLLLPLLTHAGLLGVTLLIPFPPTQIYAASALGVVAAHVASSLRVTGATAEDVRAVAQAPLHLLKKAALLPAILQASRKNHAWVRTPRE